MSDLSLTFKANTLASIEAIIKSENGENFAIEIVDLLLDYMWTKKEILAVIEDTLPEEQKEVPEMYDDCEIEYQHREYERSV